MSLMSAVKLLPHLLKPVVPRLPVPQWLSLEVDFDHCRFEPAVLDPLEGGRLGRGTV